MPQAADMLLAQMRELGVEPGDLKLIMHSQAHGDHVGPLAAVRRATGATLVSNAESRSEEQTSELQSLMRISYAVFCLKIKNRMSSTQTYIKLIEYVMHNK